MDKMQTNLTFNGSAEVYLYKWLDVRDVGCAFCGTDFQGRVGAFFRRGSDVKVCCKNIICLFDLMREKEADK